MKKIYKNRILKCLNVILCGLLISTNINIVNAADIESESNIVINEVESNEKPDWVEIYNKGTTSINISGYFLVDDAGLSRLDESDFIYIPDNTILNPGEYLVLEDGIMFNFGLGKADEVSLYNSNQELLDTVSWDSHAQGTIGRLPSGTGDFQDLKSTKGEENTELFSTPTDDNTRDIVINEINSAPDDWVELKNVGLTSINLASYEIRDDSNDHRWQFPSDAIIGAGEYYVVDGASIGLIYNDQTKTYETGTFAAAIGLGGADSIRLFESGGELVDEYSWSVHAIYDGDNTNATYGRYPDGIGSFELTRVTKGAVNNWYEPGVVINEIESDGDETDWVEIYNLSNVAIDISGWYLLDNDPIGHASSITPVTSGTLLQPGAVYVFEQNKNFSFGLGANDQAVVYSSGGAVVAEYSWSAHANGVFARIPDGVGDIVDTYLSTKNKLNILVNSVVLSEIQSNEIDGIGWIELANPTNVELDISGIIIVSGQKENSYTIADGTIISANEYLVITSDTLGFELKSNDAICIYDGANIIGTAIWQEGATTSLGIYPDLKGNEYRITSVATPGSINKFSDIPDVVSWKGSQEVVISDLEFLEDSSGLDFADGKLYAVDNGTGKIWVIDVDKETGDLNIASGFENGKKVIFQKDLKNTLAAGPDAEGITVDGNGFVYIASERDNSAKGVNYNTILQVDPNVQSDYLHAIMEWNLTDSLPQVSANMGIEAVEWVAKEDVNIIDMNTNEVFDYNNYQKAIANGIFFVALEDNGHVYAYVLNDDGTSVQIADIDSKLGGAMSLDYDKDKNILWVKADNGYGNKSAMITFNNTSNPEITHVLPATNLDAEANNEGFAVIDAEYAINGQRAVYHFLDGVKTGSLAIGGIDKDYVIEKETEKPNDNNGNEETNKPDDNNETEENVTLSFNSVDISVLKSKSLKLDYVYTGVGTLTITSNDPTVATIENGFVVGKKAGTTSITITDGKYSAECKVTVTENIYATKGSNIGSWDRNSNDGFMFIIDADFEKFVGLTINGAIVDKSLYTAVSGSTIITISKEYLSTLSTGSHLIEVEFTDGIAQVVLYVDNGAVATGDKTNMFMLFGVMFVSLSGIYLSLSGKRS